MRDRRLSVKPSSSSWGRCPHLWLSLGDGEKATVISSPGQAQPYAGTSGADAKGFPDRDDAGGLAADHVAWFPGPGRRWQEDGVTWPEVSMAARASSDGSMLADTPGVRTPPFASAWRRAHLTVD